MRISCRASWQSPFSSVQYRQSERSYSGMSAGMGATVMVRVVAEVGGGRVCVSSDVPSKSSPPSQHRPVEVHGPGIVRPFQGGYQCLRSTHRLKETLDDFLVSRVLSQGGSGSVPFLLVQTGYGGEIPREEDSLGSVVLFPSPGFFRRQLSEVHPFEPGAEARGSFLPERAGVPEQHSQECAKERLVSQAGNYPGLFLRDGDSDIPEYLVQPARAGGLFQARDFGF